MKPLIPVAIGLGVLAVLLLTGTSKASEGENGSVPPPGPAPTGPDLGRLTNAQTSHLLANARASANRNEVLRIGHVLQDGGRDAEAELCFRAVQTFDMGRAADPADTAARGGAKLQLNDMGFTALANAI